jgi:hypothetical protein
MLMYWQVLVFVWQRGLRCIFFNFEFFLLIFFIFLNCFDVLKLKIIFKN